MKKINLVELLKDCPKGMELDCILLEGSVVFEDISEDDEYPIGIRLKSGDYTNLTKYGQYLNLEEAKCVIFPKGKTAWEGFVPPVKFKDGDVISSTLFNSVCIFRGEGEIKGTVDFYCGINTNSTVVYNELFIKDCKDPLEHFGDIIKYNFATEEEKEKLFQAIKDNGYKWNAETKTLENLFSYNIGKKVWVKSDKEHKYIHTIVGISRNSHGNLEYEVKEEKSGVVVHYPESLLIPIKTKEPIFKVGDRIKLKGGDEFGIITEVADCFYTIKNKNHTHCWPIKKQDNWELVPDKFDITTLKPFDKVLVRTKNFTPDWTIDFYGGYQPNIGGSFTPFCVTGGKYFQQCIPYEGNEHLLGTTNDCDEYFKTWK